MKILATAILLALGGSAGAQCKVVTLKPDAAVPPGAVFATDVALSGDRALVGVPVPFAAGTARVYESWNLTATLEPPVSADAVGFGTAVAIEGGLAIVAAPYDATWPGSTGALYTYRLGDTGWFLDGQELPEAGPPGLFGLALAADGVNVAAGAPTTAGAGRVYVYQDSGTELLQEAVLEAADGAAGDEFGHALDIDGSWLAVGAPYHEAGAVYLFERVASSWVLQQTLIAPEPESHVEFGHSLDLDDQCLAVCSPWGPAFGAVYVYENGPSGWGLTVQMSAVTGLDLDDNYIGAVAIHGGLLAFSTPYAGYFDDGRVQLVDKTASGWTPVSVLLPTIVTEGSLFGIDLSIEGERILVAAPYAYDGTYPPGPVGAAAIFNVQDDLLWSDLGYALAGSAGLPRLQGLGGVCPGEPAGLELTSAKPLAPVALVVGGAIAFLPFHGGTLVPTPRLAIVATVDPSGSLSVSGTVPVDTLGGLTIGVQAWILDSGAVQGWAASNALVATVP